MLRHLGRSLSLSNPAPTIGRSTLKGLPVADLLLFVFTVISQDM